MYNFHFVINFIIYSVVHLWYHFIEMIFGRLLLIKQVQFKESF